MKWQISTRVMINGLIVLILALAATNLAAGDSTPGVSPPNSRPHGISYAQWGASWWQWVFSLPRSNPPNPLLTTGAVDCSYGQAGRVWFLTGSLVAGVTNRSCTIPTGTWLFFPVLNSWADNVAVTPPVTVDELKQWAASIVDATELHASIDGVPVQNLFQYRAAYAPFGYMVPATDNMAQYWGADIPGKDWPTTFVFPAASDGYWLMVEPLAPGTHVISFGGTTKSGWQIEITYDINVVPKGQF